MGQLVNQLLLNAVTHAKYVSNKKNKKIKKHAIKIQ
jgi:hypothetical protein